VRAAIERTGPRFGIIVLLGLIPALIPLIDAAFVHAVGTFRDDPDYGPLLNALNLLNFHSSGIMEHPGTPVHIVGAMVLGVAWLLRLPFVAAVSPTHDILANPEFYLRCINGAFAFMSAGATYFLGWRLWRATGSARTAFVGQATVLLAVPNIVMLPHITQETLLISLATLLMALVVPVVFLARSFDATKRYAWAIGVVAGVCIATKLHVLPLVGSVWFLRDRHLRKAALGAAAVTFVIATLPGLPLYPRMAYYFLQLLIHTGHHGSGSFGILSVRTDLDNLTTLVHPGAVVFVALVASAVLLAVRVGERVETECDYRRLFLVSAVMMVAQIGLVTKFPNFYYLVPSCAVACLVMAGATQMVLSRRGRARIYAHAVFGVTLLLLFGNATTQVEAAYAQSAAYGQDNRKLNAVADTLRSKGCLVISYYESPAQDYKLFFGTTRIGWYGRMLSALYPGFLSYNVWTHRFEDFKGVIADQTAVQRLSAQKCVYLFGSATARFGEQGFIPAQFLTLVDRSHPPIGIYTAIYRLAVPAGTSWSEILPPNDGR